VNCLWAIGGIFANGNFILFVLLIFGPGSLIYNINSEIPIIILWVLSCVLNFYAGMRAIPPRKYEIFKK